MSLEYRIGDVFDRLAEIPDGTIDLIVTSPPFLALRSYLPADHPDKAKEIGSEPTPAEFIDTLLALSAEWGRVLAPHGSLCVELGDTYAGSGGAGGDYNPGGLRDGQGKFKANAPRYSAATGNTSDARGGTASIQLRNGGGNGWPLAKSLTGIPFLYELGLSYGRNLLTGQPSPAGQWRIRNRICWARPNPPVGALGDKFRPATSYITVACKGAKRYFDLDAVRLTLAILHSTGGAPPLDWHADEHPEDGDWLWKLSTQPYKGSHYATFPLALPRRLIEAMCPLRVCRECGRPSERITEPITPPLGTGFTRTRAEPRQRPTSTASAEQKAGGNVTLGWSDCGHNAWRTGVVLDPFAGSGTTLEAAQAVGRHAIGIDLDARNADLATQRVGMFMDVVA